MFFKKLITHKCLFSVNFSMFGNIEKFEPRYFPDVVDGIFYAISKNFLKNLRNSNTNVQTLCLVGGAVFLPCCLDFNLNMDDSGLINSYFYKGLLPHTHLLSDQALDYEYFDDIIFENLLLIGTIRFWFFNILLYHTTTHLKLIILFF